MNSRDKGARGEREAAEFARVHWGCVNARRAAQIGVTGGRDIERAIPGVHIEVKRAERTNIPGWMRQAVADTQPGGIPAVWHRRNHSDALLTIRAADLRRLCECFAAIEGKPIYPAGDVT